MVKQIDVQELADKLSAGAVVHLLDVREPWENETAALPGSQLVPLSQLQTRIAEIAPPDGALLVVYCHHGMRSMSAAHYLQRAGFTDVVSLAGGIDAWSVLVDPKVPRY